MIARRALLGAAAALPFAARAADPRDPALPRRSDVMFSARWARPEALEAARAFGATRLDWCYTADPRFVAAARGAGLRTVGGTLNANMTDAPGRHSWREGRILDRDGNRVAAPWMRGWGVAWGCVNAPEYRAAWLAHARAALEAGVDWLLVDDPAMNAAAVGWGGCWCAHCRDRAAAEGVDLARDMRAFQRASVTRFYAEIRPELDRIAARRVTVGCNNYRGDPGWPHDLFDLGIAELPPANATPDHIAVVLRTAEARGFPQAVTLTSDDVALNRRVAAWCYALGGWMLAPWDVYLRSTPTGSDRFFGRAEDFAPIYAMARGLAEALDEALTAGAVPEGAVEAGAPGLHAALRAPRDRRFTVLHLVQWGEEVPVNLRLDAVRLRAGEGLVTLPGAAPVRMRRDGGALVAELPAAVWYAVVLRPG